MQSYPPLPPSSSSVLVFLDASFPLSPVLSSINSLSLVSTAQALLESSKYKCTEIILLDSSTPIPASSHTAPLPPTASLDSSRLIRSDYSSSFYATLAAAASVKWRSSPLFSPHYHESGIALTYSYSPSTPHDRGEDYVRASLSNVLALEGASSSDIEILSSTDDIQRVMQPTGGSSGSNGYVNHKSGWADASGAMGALRDHVHVLGLAHGKFHWKSGSVSALAFSSPDQAPRVTGARLASGDWVSADLTVLAAGAWSGRLLDLRGSVQATAQTLAYIQLEAEELKGWEGTPVLFNLSDGFFLVPPTPDGILKVARHTHGWRNETKIPHPEAAAPHKTRRSECGMEPFIYTSLPASDFYTLPPSSIGPLQTFLAKSYPPLAARLHQKPFSVTKVCWYADTPTGDFLVDWAPKYGRSLFVATGGSGHAFKFLPVLGEKVIERIEGRGRGKGKGKRRVEKTAGEDLWRWREELEVEGQDDSRSGERGLKWADEKWNVAQKHEL